MERQYATFYLGDARFGIDILMVREINRHLEITPTEKTPKYVRGLLNLRGQIVTVIDLGVRLGLGAREIGPESRCLVLKTSADIAVHRRAGLLDDDTAPDVIGLLIDRVGDMVTVSENELDPAPANISGVEGRFLANVIKLDGGLIVALRAREVLDVEAAA